MRYHQFKPLAEGGNIFKAANFSKEDPQMLTDRINKAEVAPTVEFLEVMTGLDIADNLLGSTGKVASSGDIDVGIDKNTIDKDTLIDHMIEQGVDPEHLSKTGDSVHYMSPIWQEGGKKTDRFVQVDFMFVPDVEFAKWSMRTAPDSSYKGVYLQKLRNDLVKTADPNWKWHHFQGVLQRSDNANVFGSDPDKIARGLIGPKATKADLESVERILAAIKEHRQDINSQVRDTYKATLAPKKPGEKSDPNAPVIDEGFDAMNPVMGRMSRRDIDNFRANKPMSRRQTPQDRSKRSGPSADILAKLKALKAEFEAKAAKADKK